MEIVKSTLSVFSGVKRRFTPVGTITGIRVIDDYAHHPTEVLAILDSASQTTSGKVVIVCQPHRFTRLNSLFDEFSNCFDKADMIIIVPVYKADERETAAITSKDLYESLLSKGKDTLFANDQEELEALIKDLISNNKITSDDILLFAGAGSISKWAKEITKNIGSLE